jgi:hypothetical protein
MIKLIHVEKNIALGFFLVSSMEMADYLGYYFVD